PYPDLSARLPAADGPGAGRGGADAMLLAWNEYLYQFLLPSSKSSMTVPGALPQFLRSHQSPWNFMIATAILYAAPPLRIYSAVRRRRTAGLTVGGVKG